MSSTPASSVFGLPVDGFDGHPLAPVSELGRDRSTGPDEAGQPPPSEVEWVNSELLTISSTIEELQNRLVEANTRLASASKIETTETEIGRLFVEAQRFSEASLNKLELQIHEILGEAEAKAKQILTEATEEALEIRRQAQEAAFASTRTAQELQSAIAGFTTVNAQLLQELTALNSMLTPASHGTREIEPHHDAHETD
jgi:cell division septum initiation protein DivIVA